MKSSFDTAFKVKLLQYMYVEENTNSDVRKKYSIDEERVREWREQKGQLQSQPAKKKRLGGGSCKAKVPDMEEELVIWIERMRSQNLRVT